MYGLRARRASRPDYNIWCPCGYATSRPPTQIAKGPTFFNDPEFVLIRPMPTANAIGGRENFDLRSVDEIEHKVGLIIGS
jgi:hypothetical protein